MFSKLYLGEIKKIFRPKSIIALALLFLVFFALYSIGYEESRKYMESMEEIHTPPVQENQQESIDINSAMQGKVLYTEENIDDYISLAQVHLQAAEEQKENNKYFYQNSSDPIYRAKAMIKAFEYIKENKIYNRKIPIYSGRLYDNITTQNYIADFFEIFLIVLMVYGVVLGAGSYATELQKGSLKMVLMRPITRNKLTTAKVLALFTALTIVMAVSLIIVFLYGLRYPLGENIKMLIVFNASNVFIGTNGLMMFLNFVFSLIKLLASALFAFALGTVTKNKIIGIMLGVFISIGLFKILLALLGIGRFLFTTSIDFSVFFGVSYGVPPGGNFYLSLALFAVYISGLLASSYLIFKKRDVA